MRALLLTIGSRGDVEPFCALAQELLKRHHQVDLLVEPNWRFLAEPLVHEFGPQCITIHNLPFENASFFPNGASLQSLIDIQADYILPCYSLVCDILQQCHDDSCLVANSMATYLMTMVAKQTHLPVILIHLQPLLPNQLFPCYRLSPTNFCAAIQDYFTSRQQGRTPTHHEEFCFEINPDLYQGLLQNGLLHKSCAKNCSEDTATQQVPLPFTWDELQPILQGWQDPFTIVNAYSNHLLPPLEKSPGMGPHVHDVGPLADDFAVSATTKLPGHVQAFLESASNDKPIAIGFGSNALFSLARLSLHQLSPIPTGCMSGPFPMSCCCRTVP
jgi:hypothetical protein